MESGKVSTSETGGAAAVLPALMKRADVVAFLGVHERTLIRWERLGFGPPCVAVGGRRFYRAESVAAWLAENENRPPRGAKAAGRRPGRGSGRRG